MTDDMNQVLELHDRARKQVEHLTKKRDLFNELNQSQKKKHFIGIIGPRGVGKSVLLRQLSRKYKERALYISIDAFTEIDLFEIAKQASEVYKIEYLFLDEVHFIKTIDQDLKKIFDFLNVHGFADS